MHLCSGKCVEMVEKHRDVGTLVLRVAIGAIFAMHGWMKIAQGGIPGTAGFLGSLGFPIPNVFAVILIAVEVLGGVALILGIFTHWAAKLTAIVALVALFAVHFKNGFWAQNGGYEFILLIFAASLSILTSGPGKYSLDAMMGKKKDAPPAEPMQKM